MLYLYIFLFIHSLYSVYCLEVKPIKSCVNCKHFFLENPLSNPENGKCLLFPIKKIDKTVKKSMTRYTNPVDYEKCIFVRNNEDMCGKQGKYYEHKHGNNDDMKEFLKKLMRKFPRNDDMEFLQCPNWSC
jgi:hypothetical protein